MQATCAEITSSKPSFLINLHNLVGFEGTGFPIYQAVVGSYPIFRHELGKGTLRDVSEIRVPLSDLFYSISLEEVVGQLDFSLGLLEKELAGGFGELKGLKTEGRIRLANQSPQNHISVI